MKSPASTLSHLQQRRLDVLKKLDRARKAHRGQRLAQRDAIRITNKALEVFVRAKRAETKSATKPAPSGQDLFSMEHA